MSRKTHSITAAALIAATSLTIASAETSGAFAQDSDLDESRIETQAQVSTNVAPVFVEEEVVQALPEEPAEEAETVTETSAESLRELVAQTSKDYALSDEMRCLAGAVYFESRGEPLAGQLAVAQVIINRTESTQFPSSYCGVVHQRAQFSFVKNGHMPSIRTGSSAWKRAKAIARIAHEGLWESAAQDSLYFHAKYVRPGWSRKKVARATISTHIFYR